jgi:hypothetical protein
MLLVLLSASSVWAVGYTLTLWTCSLLWARQDHRMSTKDLDLVHGGLNFVNATVVTSRALLVLRSMSMSLWDLLDPEAACACTPKLLDDTLWLMAPLASFVYRLSVLYALPRITSTNMTAAKPSPPPPLLSVCCHAIFP